MHCALKTKPSRTKKLCFVKINYWHRLTSIRPIVRRSRSCSWSDSGYSHTFLRISPYFRISPSVCLSSVTFVLLLKPSTNLDAIWQVHLWKLWGPVTHCVKWGPKLPTGKGFLGGWNFSWNARLQIPATIPDCSQSVSPICCYMTNTNEERFRLLPLFTEVRVLRYSLERAAEREWWRHSRLFDNIINPSSATDVVTAETSVNKSVLTL